MSGSDPSKELPPSFNPGYPPVYGPGYPLVYGGEPMPGYPTVCEAGPMPGYPTVCEAGPMPGNTTVCEAGPMPGYPTVCEAGPMPGYPTVCEAGPMPGYPTVYRAGAGPMPGVNVGYNSPPYNPGYPYGHSAVVTTQPTVIVAPPRTYETDYLVYSIFTMLCCCLPIGIGALIYSFKTRDANNMGDATQARKNSRTALTLNNVALGVGIAITVAWVACAIYVSISVRNQIYNHYYG
ncbi:uncharacterized protein LOC144767642 [Lissotriton helveticus]